MQIMTALDLACERRHMEIITLLGEHERRESAQQLVKPALRTPGHPVDQVEEVEGTAFIPLTDELSGTVALEVADEASAGAEVFESASMESGVEFTVRTRQSHSPRLPVMDLALTGFEIDQFE
eukprot:m.206969 g.206969  ORF g.206969 m.206969 type:complete len:123 (-) comp53908_c0_seq6:66-434(-)